MRRACVRVSGFRLPGAQRTGETGWCEVGWCLEFEGGGGGDG